MKTLKMLAIGTLLSANFLFAQSSGEVNFGIKAGANLTNLSGSGVTSNDAKFGAYGGAFVNIPINEKFSLQPEVLYSMQGTKWTTVTLNYLPNKDLTLVQDIKLDYVNIPIVVQYEFGNGFYGEMGPQFGFLTSAKSKNKSTDLDRNPSTPVTTIVSTETDIKSMLKTADFSGIIGGGYKMANGLSVNARYSIGFVDIVKAPGTQAKNSVFSLGLGYEFK
jgi:hypothetical protein